MARKVWRLTDLQAIFSKRFSLRRSEMFIARVEIFDQRRSEERNATSDSARKHISAPPNAAGGFCSSTYKHATPNGVKPVTLFFTTSVAGGSVRPDLRIAYPPATAMWY